MDGSVAICFASLSMYPQIYFMPFALISFFFYLAIYTYINQYICFKFLLSANGKLNTSSNNIIVLFIELFFFGLKKTLFAICLVVVSLFLGLTLGLSSFVFFTGL